MLKTTNVHNGDAHIHNKFSDTIYLSIYDSCLKS